MNMAISFPSRDAYLRSSFPLSNRLSRFLWGIAYALLFRPSPQPLHAWRALVLRCFGAKLGKDCHIYPRARIWLPGNLVCEDVVSIANDAIIYNPRPISLGSHSVVSEGAYLCGAGHDYDDPDFPLVSAPIRVGAYAWLCARSNVQMGVHVGEGAVLALGGVATSDLVPWTVHAGVPARKVKERKNPR